MCLITCISPKLVRLLNYILTIILSLSITGIFVYILVKSKFTDISFKWTSIVIVLGLIMAFVAALLLIGGLSLCYNNSLLYSVFFVLSLMSVVAFLSIGIFSLVNSSTKAISAAFGCNTTNEELHEDYKDYDSYLFEVDKILCSDDCECSLTHNNFTSVAEVIALKRKDESDKNVDLSIQSSIDHLVYTEEEGKPTSFDKCNEKAQEKAENEFLESSQTDMNNEDIFDFVSWYSLLETHFDCVGLCNTTYIEGGYFRMINKYLFTNINRGPPLYNGCLNSVAEWAPDQLLILGLISIGLGIISIFISWLTCTTVFMKDSDNK